MNRALDYRSWNRINEQFNLELRTSISDYIDDINDTIRPLDKNRVIEWWNNNLSNINIHYFDFANHMIGGAAIDENNIAINRIHRIPAEIKLFITLHECRHTYHYSNMGLERHYFETVIEGDKEEFLDQYQRLEADANDFAFRSCRELGIIFPPQLQHQLRHNENIGNQVYRMMKKDIEETGATSMKDLLLSQLL